MTGELAGFRHEFRPGTGRTFLLLHGTGGSESDLIPLGEALDREAALLSPRGKVLENGMARFFRRFAEGVLDFEDVAVRAKELATFIDAACHEYELDPHSIVAVGYSNGANIAAALLLLYPGVLAGAALFRAMVPVPESHTRSRRPAPLTVPVPVLIANGRRDTITPIEQGERLAELLRADGASVTMHWHAGGHGLTQGDVDAARAWLAASPPA
jgi:predicted esterase